MGESAIASPPAGSGIVAIGAPPARVVILPDAVASGPTRPRWVAGLVALAASGLFFAQLVPSVSELTFAMSPLRSGSIATLFLMLGAGLLHQSFRLRVARHELAELNGQLAIREIWRGRMLRYREAPFDGIRSIRFEEGDVPCVILDLAKGQIVVGRGLSSEECRWLARTLSGWLGRDDDSRS